MEVILESEDFKKFLKHAREYCRYIEESKDSGVVFLNNIQNYLLNLYQYIVKVKLVEIIYENNSSQVSDIDYNQIRKIIEERLPINYYWSVFNPLDEKEHDAIIGSLDDDLADIYVNIKEAIVSFDTNKIESIEDALWGFKYDFIIHWGYHLNSALNVIHWYLRENYEFEY
ncbi:MAG TPA: DUF5063 domain-containing protein [Ignavibacteria bacterium]|nr:DUF5063 domain-containing protein [Ignavibacteria bacterium]